MNRTQKHWWQSWTIIGNLLLGLAPVLDILLQTNLIQDKEIYAIIVAVLNILNRFRVQPGEPVKAVKLM